LVTIWRSATGTGQHLILRVFVDAVEQRQDRAH
jgi:hypothetical protein